MPSSTLSRHFALLERPLHMAVTAESSAIGEDPCVGSNGGRVLSPPPRTQASSVVGYDCDEVRPLSAVFEQPTHSRCAGWWPDQAEDTDGWRCACPCHELGAGWPGYEQR